MPPDYSSRLERLLVFAKPRIMATRHIEFKNFFGAVAAYVDGKIFASCGKFGFALRLPEKTRDALLSMKGNKKLRYFPNGHIKKEYIVLCANLKKDRPALRKLIDRSIDYAGKITSLASR